MPIYSVKVVEHAYRYEMFYIEAPDPATANDIANDAIEGVEWDCIDVAVYDYEVLDAALEDPAWVDAAGHDIIRVEAAVPRFPELRTLTVKEWVDRYDQASAV